MITPMSTLTMPNGKTYEIVDKQARKTIERDCATVVTQTVEGAGIAVTDSSNRPVRNLKLFGKTKQTTTPSPDRPQDLESVETPTVTIRGGNLIPADYADGTSKTMNGITFEALPDGSVLVNGTATATAYFSFNITSNKIQMPNGWLSTSSGIGHGSGIPHVQNDIYVDGIYVTSVQTVWESSSKRQFFGKVELGASRIKVDTGITVVSQRIYPMLCAFENVIDYEPPKAAQTLMIDRSLSGLPVDENGTYTDSNGQQWICDEINFKRGVYIQRVKSRTFDGTEDWMIGEQNAAEGYLGVFYTANNDALAGCTARCSHYIQGNGVGVIDRQGQFDTYYNQFRINIGGFTTVDEWKTQLAEWNTEGNPLTLIYQLATPIETPLTEEELAAFNALYTHKTVTSVLNDADAWTEMEYSADLETFIRNLVAGLGGSGGSSGGSTELPAAEGVSF